MSTRAGPSITREEVERIASLANLSLSDADIAKYARDLKEILGYVNQLNELDTEGVEPMAQVLHAENLAPLRADTPGPSFDQDTALRSAPLAGDGHFKVPKVIDR